MTEKKQALVTGANKGIGLAIAKGLADQGMTVWMGARDPERGEKAVSQRHRKLNFCPPSQCNACGVQAD